MAAEESGMSKELFEKADEKAGSSLLYTLSMNSYLLHGMVSFDNRHQLESTRRTLENMVAGGLLERVTVYESRQIRRGGETNATVVRYGLPGQCAVMRDTGGADNAISGEYMRVS